MEVKFYVFIVPARSGCQLSASFCERLDGKGLLIKLTFAEVIKNLSLYGAQKFIAVFVRP